MNFESIGPTWGRQVRLFCAMLSFRWVVYGTSVIAFGIFVWMFRYGISGDGMIFDRLNRTAIKCIYYNTSICYEVYPSKVVSK